MTEVLGDFRWWGSLTSYMGAKKMSILYGLDDTLSKQASNISVSVLYKNV